MSADTSSKRFNVVIIGSSCVGKSSIFHRLTENEFKDPILVTISACFCQYTTRIDNDDIKLRIWDTPGLERFRFITKAYFRIPLGAILVFDVTSRQSFDDLANWLKDFQGLCNPNAIILLLGNKADLDEIRIVSSDEGREFAHRHDLLYIETSAKNGHNITDAFKKLAAEILKKARKDGQRYQNQNNSGTSSAQLLPAPNSGTSECSCYLL